MELNYDYRDSFKVMKDIQKLIDPDNAYQQSLYFAYGKKRDFYGSVKSGIERAFNAFMENQPEFRLPVGLHAVVVEYIPGHGHLIHETSVAKTCTPAELTWKETTMNTTQVRNLGENAQLTSGATGSTVTELGAPERKVWIHWPSPVGQKYFLAFVNQFGSCSLRKFDAGTGLFLGMQRGGGDFQLAFKPYFHEGNRLNLSRQPNLQVQCRPKLPDWVLAELQRQIKDDAQMA